MKRRNIALALVLGIGGLTLAARELLSFNVDAAGVKGIARAVITHAGAELGIDASVQKKVTGLAESGIDQAVPILRDLNQNLAAVDESRLDAISKGLGSLIDLKDRLVSEAGKQLTPKERVTAIVKVGRRFKERHGSSPDTMEGLVDSFRSHRQSMLKHELGLDDARAAKLFGAMEPFHQQRKANREAHRTLFDRMDPAVTGNAADAVFAGLITEWDTLNAKASDVTRAQLAEGRKQLTPAEQVKLAKRAREKIERGMRIVALIGKFAPIR